MGYDAEMSMANLDFMFCSISFHSIPFIIRFQWMWMSWFECWYLLTPPPLRPFPSLSLTYTLFSFTSFSLSWFISPCSFFFATAINLVAHCQQKICQEQHCSIKLPSKNMWIQAHRSMILDRKSILCVCVCMCVLSSVRHRRSQKISNHWCELKPNINCVYYATI